MYRVAAYISLVSSGADYIGHGEACAPTFAKWLDTGDTVNCKRETDETVLTLTKALAKMTDCTRGAKKVEGHDKKMLLAPGV